MRSQFTTRLVTSLIVGTFAALPLLALAQGPSAGALPGAFPPPCPTPPAMHALGQMPMPPFLIGLKLSEAQQDKIFEIMHGAAPLLREQAKALRKAEEEARNLMFAERDDERATQVIAENIGRNVSEMHRLRLRTDRQILQLLTPEQRLLIKENQQKFKLHSELPSTPEKIAARQGAREFGPSLTWALAANDDKRIFP